MSHVFNFDVPIHAEDYVHRIGRTGRAGMIGHAFTLATPDDRGFVDAIEKLVGAEIPRIAVEGMDPVAFPEDDGRRRRGRGRGAKPAEKRPARAAAPEPGTDSIVQPGATDAPRPRRSRAKKPEAAVTAPAEQVPAEAVAEPRRERRPREDARPRDEARPHETARPREETRAREETRSREERPRDDRGADRSRSRESRRPDDLGPAVVGFGDDVPAFMMLRSRRPAAAAT